MRLFVVGQSSADRMDWNKPFTRYSVIIADSPESAREAAFADRAEYLFKKVDGVVPVTELPYYVLETEQTDE